MTDPHRITSNYKKIVSSQTKPKHKNEDQVDNQVKMKKIERKNHNLNMMKNFKISRKTKPETKSDPDTCEAISKADSDEATDHSEVEQISALSKTSPGIGKCLGLKQTKLTGFFTLNKF